MPEELFTISMSQLEIENLAECISTEVNRMRSKSSDEMLEAIILHEVNSWFSIALEEPDTPEYTNARY